MGRPFGPGDLLNKATPAKQFSLAETTVASKRTCVNPGAGFSAFDLDFFHGFFCK